MKLVKIKKVKLAKPIHTVIEIKILTYFCKVGYTCSAGRLVVNSDYDNAIYSAYTSQTPSCTLRQLKDKMFTTFVGFEKYRNVSDNYLLEAGVFISIDVSKASYRDCKDFGVK